MQQWCREAASAEAIGFQAVYDEAEAGAWGFSRLTRNEICLYYYRHDKEWG